MSKSSCLGGECPPYCAHSSNPHRCLYAKYSEIPNCSMIVAMDKNNVIGNNNEMLWHIPMDLALFKGRTNGNCIIMGRNTYESIGKPLPNRDNIVISSKPTAEGTIRATSLEEALLTAEVLRPSREHYIIGGQQVYEQAMPYAKTLYVSRIHECFNGNKFFPKIPGEFKLESFFRYELFDHLIYRRS